MSYEKGKSIPSAACSTGCAADLDGQVKCDEVHPRCGPCTRLNKNCDWEQRWKFEEATRSTQSKFSNVNTSGNAVWDPSASSQSSRGHSQPQSPMYRRDSLPSFAELDTDEARERKAETQAPGTFNVIVNPNSFSKMPEYASPTAVVDSRRQSLQSVQSGMASQASDPGRVRLPGDPNTVLLTRFEDPSTSLASFTAAIENRRASLPGQFQDLNISNLSPEETTRAPVPRDPTYISEHDHTLIRYFERFVSTRILPASPHCHQFGLQDPIVAESRTFLPLHHAICAVALLAMHHRGMARWQDALERESQATRLLASSLDHGVDLNGDGILYLHFLLLVYDVSTPSRENSMQYHMLQLRRIAVTRNQLRTLSSELFWQISSFAMVMDIQAALSGCDNGGLAAAQAAGELSPTPAMPLSPMNLGSPLHHAEVEMLGPMIRFASEMTSLTARLSVLALHSRNKPSDPTRRQQAIASFHRNMWEAWASFYPPWMQRDDPHGARLLVGRLRQFFETAYVCHCINFIYSSTCVLPRQIFSNPSLSGEVNRQCRHVVVIAQSVQESRLWANPPILFALFLAGVATTEPEVKSTIINLFPYFEQLSINRNARKAKDLLLMVCDEQRNRILNGGSAEEVDWVNLAHERHMEMIDFGL